MEMTAPYEELNKEVVGYMLNSPLSIENQKAIRELQQRFEATFGDVIWSLPVESLHITLMDWVAPLVDYERDKDEIFREIFPEYDSVLEGILADFVEIPITFSEVHVSSGGVYLTARDEGQFKAIRDEFLEKIALIPGTKQPPSIIHTTVARFNKAVDLKPIQHMVERESVSFSQRIDRFILVRETKIPMLEREIIKSYPLAS